MLPDPQLSRVVLLGAGTFRSAQLPDLPAVDNNLADLKQALSDPETGIIAADHCTTASPESPRGFLSRLRRPVNEAEDLLLVYYAGHGVRHERKDRLYLTTWDTDPDELDTTAVPFESVRELIEASIARTRLLILDCCYSGLALGAMSAAALDVRTIEVTGTTVIASSPKNSISHAPAGERHTAFTAELLKLLKTGSPLPGEPLDVARLFGSLRAAMARRDLPLPKMQAGDTSSGLVLRRTPPPPPEPLPPEPPPVEPPEPRLPVQPPQVPPQRDEPPVVRAAEPPETVVKLLSYPPSVLREDAIRRLRGAWFRGAWTGVVLWIWTVMAGTYGIGGTVGALFGSTPPGTTSGDLPTGIGGLALAAPCVWLLWRRRRPGRTRVGFADAFPELARTGEIVWGMVLVGSFIFGATMTIVGLILGWTDTTARPTSGVVLSNLATTAGLLGLFGSIAVGSGWALIRRYRRTRVTNAAQALGDTAR